jgi:hypothetical protein
VLDCELFLTRPRPVLLWQKVVRTSWHCKPEYVGAAPSLLCRALDRAICMFVESLAADVPSIRRAAERIERASTASGDG